MQIRHQIGTRFDIVYCISVMLVVVVTDVPRVRLRLVAAIRRHGRRSELERQKGKQDNGEKMMHGS